MTNFLIGCIVGITVTSIVMSIIRSSNEKDKIEHYKY